MSPIAIGLTIILYRHRIEISKYENVYLVAPLSHGINFLWYINRWMTSNLKHPRTWDMIKYTEWHLYCVKESWNRAYLIQDNGRIWSGNGLLRPYHKYMESQRGLAIWDTIDKSCVNWHHKAPQAFIILSFMALSTKCDFYSVISFIHLAHCRSYSYNGMCENRHAKTSTKKKKNQMRKFVGTHDTLFSIRSAIQFSTTITCNWYLLVPTPCPPWAVANLYVTIDLLTMAIFRLNLRQIEIRAVDFLRIFLCSTANRCVCKEGRKKKQNDKTVQAWINQPTRPMNSEQEQKCLIEEKVIKSK